MEWSPVGVPEWRELFPRPDRVSAWRMAARLFWNPQGNERLFMVSCAERLVRDEDPESAAQIEARVRRARGAAGQARFRIVFVHRVGGGLRRDVLYLSPPFSVRASP